MDKTVSLITYEYVGKPFTRMCGTTSRALRRCRKETQLKFYKTMAVPTLLYRWETWIIKNRNESKLQAAEMKFLRTVKGRERRDHIRNEDIRGGLKIFAILDKIKEYRRKWLDHINRTADNRLPKM